MDLYSSNSRLLAVSVAQLKYPHNNHMHSDSKKRRSFLAMLFAAGDVKRSSALRADERARVVPNIGFLARSAVEPSLERYPFGATSSSCTRVR